MEAASADHPSPRPPAKRRPWSRWLAQRGAELFTVFIGVYAAFLLNDYQSRRQQRQRHAQILNWMDSIYTEEADSIVEEVAVLRKHSDEFNRANDAGEMPALHAFEWSSDYNPTDIAGVLQNGGYDLLDIETIRAIKEADGILRRMVALLAHDQGLSDAQILPNLDKPPETFYDPATKKLRPTYRWYPQFFKVELADYADLKTQVGKALDCIHRERVRDQLGAPPPPQKPATVN